MRWCQSISFRLVCNRFGLLSWVVGAIPAPVPAPWLSFIHPEVSMSCALFIPDVNKALKATLFSDTRWRVSAEQRLNWLWSGCHNLMGIVYYCTTYILRNSDVVKIFFKCWTKKEYLCSFKKKNSLTYINKLDLEFSQDLLKFLHAWAVEKMMTSWRIFVAWVETGGQVIRSVYDLFLQYSNQIKCN